ncbi:hypothetical protein [Chromobacterium rhizoryzae]|uniref:hypothetical protein n=1 Tax=Chromobacterium rhizoryzae TaxID=1778675 RepID=UPI0013C3302F|nr:hypothetical protein [Chromobacterium rhizoryzae]
MLKITAAVIIVCSLFTSPALAALKTSTPSVACSLLDSVDLATGSWKNIYENKYGCNSQYKHIGTAFPLANNIAYYVEGNSNSVSMAKLVLNINDQPGSTVARKALASSSEILSKKITGLTLPASIKSAITSGKPEKAKAGMASIEVTRNNWPTGKRYEIHVIFQ